MMKHRSFPNYYFWGLTFLASSLVGLGLMVSWAYSQGWWQALWSICQTQLDNLRQNQFVIGQLFIPAILLIMGIRGSLTLLRQGRATWQLARTFYPLHEAHPPRLQKLLVTHNFAAKNIVFLNLPSPHAFCLGFFRPRIWLTAGLLSLLSEAELVAVLAHEQHHALKRDPLRLLISRAIKSAFFFLPGIKDLAQAVEVQQEIAADQAAILVLGNDLPLLCALQKLMTHNKSLKLSPNVAYSPFNVTEARLRRLIYPPPPTQWYRYVGKWGINMSIIVGLGLIVIFSARPVAAHQEIITCTPDSEETLLMQTAWLDYNH
jgi:Zn-dependent protease with chaperone function